MQRTTTDRQKTLERRHFEIKA